GEWATCSASLRYGSLRSPSLREAEHVVQSEDISIGHNPGTFLSGSDRFENRIAHIGDNG
ncbi:MAG: hypothetical protein NT069_10740, partial [Planctomycetota bacterium]|nr:hypothetical protein [Planctomycetota bacterium]